MVHSETSDQCGADDGSGEFPPSIAGPMQQAAHKIYNKLSGDEANHNRCGANVILKCSGDEFPPKPKSKGHVRALKGTLSIGVMIIPEILFGR